MIAVPPLRVAIVPERYGRVLSPCASIRLQPFFDAMDREAGIEFRYLLPSELRRYSPDVIVWHRVSIVEKADLDLLRELRNQRGTRLVFDLDDNLLDLEGHGERASYEAMSESVRVSIALADEVWTSTSRLAARAARETSAVINVLPNVLDPELWAAVPSPSAVPRRGQPLRLLYMGTRTHDADFALLEQALTLLQAQRPGCFELSVVGVRTRAGVAPGWLRTLDPPPHVGASYPAFVAWFSQLSGFDLGVAPLMSSPFNDCKSPIKVLDYAAIGLPTLASSVPAYTDSLRTGLDCLHADNNAADWSRVLAELASHRARLSPITENARRLVAPEAFAEGVRLRQDRIASATDPPLRAP